MAADGQSHEPSSRSASARALVSALDAPPVDTAVIPATDSSTADRTATVATRQALCVAPVVDSPSHPEMTATASSEVSVEQACVCAEEDAVRWLEEVRRCVAPVLCCLRWVYCSCLLADPVTFNAPVMRTSGVQDVLFCGRRNSGPSRPSLHMRIDQPPALPTTCSCPREMSVAGSSSAMVCIVWSSMRVMPQRRDVYSVPPALWRGPRPPDLT